MLVLTVAAQDADRDAVVLALREAGVATTVVSRDGAGHTFTCGLAFDTLSAAHGGVFLIDRRLPPSTGVRRHRSGRMDSCLDGAQPAASAGGGVALRGGHGVIEVAYG